jgi:tripartite-type tricarboxylate transporter receptor subunit TctC
MDAVIAIASAAALIGPLLAATVTRAAEFPTRTITLVVPYPAGGGVDAMARVVAQKLSDAFHQTVNVDNRGGGGGTIGTRAVARAAPDGYTLLLGHTGTISINPSLYAKLGMNPRKDFAPIGLVASMPVALLAHPSFPARTAAEFIALAKKDPGKLNVGTSSVGTGGYTCAELFKAEAGIDIAIIPYKGTAPVMNDLLGGHVPIAFGVLPPALGNIEAGQLRAIAVTSKKRFSLLPDAHLRRVRDARLRSRAALRAAGAARHRAGDRRTAEHRAQQARQRSGGAETHPSRRRRSARLDAGRIRRRHRPRRKRSGASSSSSSD